MKSQLNVQNNILYIYSMKTLLYNLLHLNYKYMYNKENKTIEKKKINGKDKRDKKRLDIFFRLYCHFYYPQLSLKDINTIYKNILSHNDSFKLSIEKIKDLSVIDSFFI